MTVRLLVARGPVPAGTVCEHESLCDTRGTYDYTYVRLADGSYLCVSPWSLEPVEP